MASNWATGALLAAAVLGGSLAVASPAAAVPLATGGFERDLGGWMPTSGASIERVATRPHRGSAALAARLVGRLDAGTQLPVTFETLFRAGLSGAVTRTVQGTFAVSVWVRGGPGMVGRNVRLQINETGGATADEVLGGVALSDVRLGRGWRRVSTGGSVRRPDRAGVLVLLIVPSGRRGDVFFVDDYRLTGEPLALGAATSERWPWWVFAAVWSAVLASGAVWLLWARRDRVRIRNREASVFATARPPRRSNRRGEPT